MVSQMVFDPIQASLYDPPIKRIIITGLFGDRDVDIPFDSPVTILVADNGAGKTTILGMIYAVLSGRLYNLRRYTFESISVETRSGRISSLTAESVRTAALSTTSASSLDTLSAEQFYRYLAEANNMIAEVIRGTSLQPSDVVEQIVRAIGEREGDGQFQRLASEEMTKDLADSLPYPTLYFPTYRRIEEDIEELGYARQEGTRTERLMRFGMSDVTQRIKDITGKIEKSSIESYSRISGQMLSQLVDGITLGAEAQMSIRNESALGIVLDRVGNNITPERKTSIMRLVQSGEITQPGYETLAYFLSNLIKVYDQQREYDVAIKEFTRVCNKYLVDKEVVYNESSVEIQVVYRSSRKPVELAKLSSGEKQIVSLFSRLYLEGSDKLAVLFDEPELSLSIEWQKMLLPDIVNSGRCCFLLATTHSPFIFENELDAHAYDLSRFIRRLPV